MTSSESSKQEEMSRLLEVSNLSIEFESDTTRLCAVKNISFEIEAGETVGLVGESGCGKSVTALSVMRLLPQPMGTISEGQILFEDRDLTRLDSAEIEKIRGAEIGMVFQEPMTALNPVQTIGKQIAEALLIHSDIDQNEAIQRTLEMLELVGIPSPEIRLGEYPHQLSGGMRQRVVIAIALICNPRLLIADEPTTALDVTIQAQILDLISKLQKDLNMAVLLITHDLGIIANSCDRVLVMYAGNIVESGKVEDIFERPAHPYTRGLLNSIPRLDNTSKARLKTIEGLVPSLADMPQGCRFENRCEFAQQHCSDAVPGTEEVSNDHYVSCYHWKDAVAAEAGMG